MTPEQLRTLSAAVDAGTLDAAAMRLRLTPSAVSQRIKALEREVGRVLLRRTVPCTPTPAGEILLRAARAARLIEEETRAALQAGGLVPSVLPVAVNADSLASWFGDVLAAAAGWPEVTLRVVIQDEGRTAALLRDGSVLAAVTTDPVPVPGCAVTPLGAMRYRPVGRPDLAGRGWSGRPLVAYDGDDDLHVRVLRPGDPRPGRVHHIASAEGCLTAIRAGLGWGVVSEQQVPDPAAAGLVPLDPARWFDRPLHWQASRLASSDRLDRLSAAVGTAAGRRLRTGGPAGGVRS